MAKKDLTVSFGSPDRPLKIGDFEIQCYVLNDSRRVLVQRGMIKALGMSYGGSADGGADRLARFVQGKALNPFINKELEALITHPIKFQSPSGEAYGYEATILVDICDAVIQANKEGKLQKQQAHIAEQAEMLIRAFAKTGIIALIDEATGFQEVREKDALKQFLEKFLLDERGKWVKAFPDEFFEMIFKMRGWTWHYASTKKPGVVGKYINDFVYSRIGPQVLEELKKKQVDPETGKKSHMHRFLTPNYGHPQLREHIASLIALGKASGYNWKNFNRMVERAFPVYKPYEQFDMFPDDVEDID